MILENDLFYKTFLCSLLQILVLASSIQICKIFNIVLFEKRIFEIILRKISFQFLLYLGFFSLFFLVSSFLMFLKKELGLQLSNLIFFLLLILELCFKIGKSEKFINWIGPELNQNFRIFIMFIIALNIIYFLTRITYGIILS